MNFYECIHILSYIFIYCNCAFCLKNADLKLEKSGSEDITPCAVGLKLYAIVNNTSSSEDYDVELVPDQCCLKFGTDVDCDVLKAVGNCAENIPRGTLKTLNLVAPILDPYERKGYCLAYLDSKSVHRKRNVVTMRDAVKIPFDTRLKNYKRLPAGVQQCKELDEDPLNQCHQVNCEKFYNEKKSYYHRIKKRCVQVPRCISNQGDMPNAVLDLTSNKCIVDEPITKDDLDYIKSLKHSNGRVIKDIVIIKKGRNGPMNITEFPEKEFRGVKKTQSNNDFYGNAVLCFIKKNKSGFSFLFCIIVLQCGLICTMIYFIARRCLCKKGSTIIEKKFFNYRQDASVTTPLIGLTTIETETTCQFTSESSHIEKKIQCYKACQKENAKISLSDDILSKCLNRRNWDRKQVKSEAVEMRTDRRNDNSKNFDTLFMSAKKDEQKVIFEDDKDKKVPRDDKKTKETKTLVKKGESKKTVPDLTEVKSFSDPFVSEREIKCLTYKYKDSKPFVDSKPQSTGISEKEIRCHSYNYGMEAIERLDNSFKISSHSYSDIQSTSKQPQIYSTALDKVNSNATSMGRQASAQASFSNDSIDDYLSERGMLFLTGENISKYSFSDASLKSSVSSKTSKNNLVKHVLSYLKREKHGPASDPGGKKADEEVNLELIHMSKATMYSSSNNGTECIKNISRVKDSRTSL